MFDICAHNLLKRERTKHVRQGARRAKLNTLFEQMDERSFYVSVYNCIDVFAYTNYIYM